MLIKYESAADTFTAIGGARSGTLTVNNETVDITNADSAGIRTLLEGAGNTSVSLKLQGVYVDDAAIGDIRDDAMTNAFRAYQVVVPGSTANVTYEGTFQVASYEEAGEYNGAMTYNLTLESAGTVMVS